jgi:hypothetical protein
MMDQRLCFIEAAQEWPRFPSTGEDLGMVRQFEPSFKIFQ